MARQQRNDVDYFPHPTRNGKKMKYLRQKYGDKGYTVWYGLLENLGSADYHYLNLSDPLQRMFVASDLDCDEKVMTAIIDELVLMKEFDGELWKEGQILFGQEFVNSIADAYKKRSNSIIERDELLSLLVSKGELNASILPLNEPKGIPKVPVNPQSKVEYSKEEKSKAEDKLTLFLDFWDKYHFITRKPKTDKEAAFKYWKKLDVVEMDVAIEKISYYFNSLSDPKYCKKARTYLADKNFNDEFQVNANTASSVTIKQFKAND